MKRACLMGAMVVAVFAMGVLGGMKAMCVAVLAMAVVLWVTEWIPLVATSLLVVWLLSAGAFAWSPGDAGMYLKEFGNPILVLFLGGFVMAGAIQRAQVDRWVAHGILRLIPHRPLWVLGAVVMSTMGISMWISNTAATLMMLPMALSLANTLPENDRFRMALLLAVPFSANVGGMATPVGTPPNAIAMAWMSRHGMGIGFGDWMGWGVPLSLGCAVMVWAVLGTLFYTKSPLQVQPERVDKGPSFWVTIITLGVAIVAWMTGGIHGIPDATIALGAAVALVLLGAFPAHSLGSLEWPVVVLMWGGLCLGLGLETTGVSAQVGQWLTYLPPSYTAWVSVGVAGLLSSVMNDTATANVVIPMVGQIPSLHPALTVFMAAVSSSAAMVLPVSCAPNAVLFGRQLIPANVFVRAGVLVTLGVMGVIIGFAAMVSLF